MNNVILLAAGSVFTDPVGNGKSFADSWARFSGLGIQTFLLGVLTVFSVLAILWGCLEIFRYFFYTVPERKKAEEKVALSAKNEAAPVVSEPVQETVSAPVSDDGEIVAAIIAAITAMRNDEAAENGELAPGAFRVVSFRKRH